jgi:hypothetical protein
MIVQRLQAAGTLAEAVQLLVQGIAAPLLQDCKRMGERRISSRPGGYCRARQRLPKLVCRQLMREILQQLRQLLSESGPDQRPIYVLDGFSLDMEHCPELLAAYPPWEINLAAVTGWSCGWQFCMISKAAWRKSRVGG